MPVVRRHAFSCEERPPGDRGVEQPLLALGVFATAQPFVELLTFLYDGAHELGASGPLRLFVFKRGCLPDTSAHSVASRGSRLEIDLCQLCTSNSSMTLHDATAALLTLAVSATWTHEAHVTGVELRFTGAGVASAFLWYDAAMATDADAVRELREEAVTALQLDNADDALRDAPFLPEAAARAAPEVRVPAVHPNPELEVLRKTIEQASASPAASAASLTPPQLAETRGGLLEQPARRHTAFYLNGLREEMRKDRRRLLSQRRQARNTTTTCARGGPTPGDTGDAGPPFSSRTPA